MTQIIIESLNIGKPQAEMFGGKEVTTGICKKPVSCPLYLKKTGFEGDGVADLNHHGGYDKAVCVYSMDHYPYWEEVLEVKMPVAAFGENLSVANLSEEDVCIGDIFQLGRAIVIVSQPRQPCKTLAARYGRSDLVKLVADSGRTGFYFKVMREGEVDRTDKLVLMERDSCNVTVSFANHIFHHDKRNCSGIEKVLDVHALSESWTKSFQLLKEKCLS